jgi:hypothetical protein
MVQIITERDLKFYKKKEGKDCFVSKKRLGFKGLLDELIDSRMKRSYKDYHIKMFVPKGLNCIKVYTVSPKNSVEKVKEEKVKI